MPTRITDAEADALEPHGEIRDDALRGFLIRRQRRGVFYCVTYCLHGKRGRITIGRHGPKSGGWTAAKARREALQIIAAVAAGVHPAAQISAIVPTRTLSELAERWLEDEVTPRRKPRTAAEYERNLRRVILPKLGSLKVEAVVRTDVLLWHASLKDRKVAANRSLDILSGLMRFAEKLGERPDGSNPCRHVEPYPERPRERRLTARELARLGEALEQAAIGFEDEATRTEWRRRCEAAAEDEGIAPAQRAGWITARQPQRLSSEDPRAIALIRLLIFTGARRDEIRTARWEWLDPARAVLRLPDSKTGAKTIHLAPPALEVLSTLARLADNPHILAGDRLGKPFSNVKDPWLRIRSLAALPDLRLHDLRHAFASVAASAGDSLYMIGAVLGHRQASTTQRYAHLADHSVGEVATRNAERIRLLMQRTAPPVLLADT